MCIFVAPVLRVTKTRILIAPLENNRQLTVYENQVMQQGSGRRNAMVLPVPSGGEVELLDLSQYTGSVWEDCEALIPPERRNSGGGWGFGAGGFGSFGASSARPPLPVQRVGGYRCSVVPTLEDFPRVSKDVFDLPPDIEAILREHYSGGFSFVVCIFVGNVVAHPIAYTSSRLLNGQCFIPTRHAHGKGNAQVSMVQLPAGGGELPTHNAHCDVCRTHPIRGNRWKCQICNDYDMCNVCYTQQRNAHDASHLFVHIPYPVTAAGTFTSPTAAFASGEGGFAGERTRVIGVAVQSIDGSMFGPAVVSNAAFGFPPANFAFGESAEDKFDHTLYLLNCVLVASPKRYTKLRCAEQSKGVWSGGLYQLPLPRTTECVTRVQIEGAFENDDYVCVEVK